MRPHRRTWEHDNAVRDFHLTFGGYSAGADRTGHRQQRHAFRPRQTTDDEEPAFLPSGGQIVFAGTRAAGRQNLFTVSSYPGFDPELTNATNAALQGVETAVVPNARTYTVGCRIGF